MWDCDGDSIEIGDYVVFCHSGSTPVKYSSSKCNYLGKLLPGSYDGQNKVAIIGPNVRGLKHPVYTLYDSEVKKFTGNPVAYVLEN